MADDDNDHEITMQRIFDPKNIDKWLEVAPLEFLAMIAHEFLREGVAINAWTELLLRNPTVRDATLVGEGGDEVPVETALNYMLKSYRVMKLIYDFTLEYKH